MAEWHYKKMVAHGVMLCWTCCTEKALGFTLLELQE